MVSKRRVWKVCVASALIAAVLGSGFTLYLMVRIGPLGKIWEIVNVLDRSFHKSVDRQAAFEGAARGAVAALGDPYSAYMDAGEWQEYLIRTSGEYTGIGITIDVKDDMVRIAEPMKGTPAETAGLRAGDIILRVDGEVVKSSDEASARIRGPADTDVTLTILRTGTTFDLTITRKPIMMPAVSHEMLDEQVGLIQLMSFNEHSFAETKLALEDLKAQGVQGIVLDVRYNGGGFVDQCLNIAELFVPEGKVVSLRYKDEIEKVSVSHGKGLGMPLVVLINGGTASASEILAGAIQDRGVGTLIGTKTFGKGLVQSIFYLADKSVVKVTTAEYLTPNGRSIHGQGLLPDIEVQGDPAQLAKALDIVKESFAE